MEKCLEGTARHFNNKELPTENDVYVSLYVWLGACVCVCSFSLELQ